MDSSSVGHSGSLVLEARLVACASNQLGVFTVQQAAEAGVSANALYFRKQSGLIVPLQWGVYRLAAVEESAHQHALAACLAVPSASIGGTSAAAIHGLPARPRWEDSPPTLIVPHETSLRISGMNLRRTRHPFLTEPWHTVRVTQVSSTLISLAGMIPRAELARCIDHAIAHRLVSVARLLEEVESRPTARFTGRAALLEEIHARVDQQPVHRSKYEQRVARWIRQSSLPKPRTNYAVPIVGRGTVVEVDVAWPDSRVALEISPFFTHGSERTQRRDMQRRVFLQESRWSLVEATDEHLESARAFAPILESVALLLRLGVVSQATPTKPHPFSRESRSNVPFNG